jgi:hypothetical protein
MLLFGSDCRLLTRCRQFRSVKNFTLYCWHLMQNYHVSSPCNYSWYEWWSPQSAHSNLSLPSIRSSFSYCLGTVVAVCGRILSHQVDRSSEGDRACCAWFMREDVSAHLDVAAGPTTLQGVLTSGILWSHLLITMRDNLFFTEAVLE